MRRDTVRLPIFELAEGIPAGSRICQLYENENDAVEMFGWIANQCEQNGYLCVWALPRCLSAEAVETVMAARGMLLRKSEGASNRVILLPVSEWSSETGLKDLDRVAGSLKKILRAMDCSDIEGLCVLSGVSLAEDNQREVAEVLSKSVLEQTPLKDVWQISQYDMTTVTQYGMVDLTVRYDGVITRRQGEWQWTDNHGHIRLKQDLEDSKSFYLTLFDDFPALIWRSGTDTLCNYFNRNWLSFTGRTIEQEMGNGWAEGVHPEDFDRCVAYYLENFKLQKPFSMDYRLRRHDGEYRWILDMGMPFKDLYGNFAGYIGSCYDITERIDMERRLQVTVEEEQQANAAKSIFLSQMSHEIRTPMSGVIGMLDILSMGALDKEQVECVELARTSAKRLVRIINDILDYSRIETGHIELENYPFDLSELVKSVLESLRINKKDPVGLRLEMAQDVPTLLVGDQIRISQILINLISNSLKFTDQGEVVLGIEVADETADRLTLRCTVRDTGIGIPTDQQDKLFNRFAQMDNIGKRKWSGSGLWLVITRLLVQRMGGAIHVESKEGAGSRFEFTIQLEKQMFDEDVMLATEVMPVTERDLFREIRRTILVVDDDEINVQVMVKALGGAYTVETACHGLEAVEKYEKNLHDIILMDVNMPVMDGYMATEKIRRMEQGSLRSAHIIGFTARAMKSDEDACLLSGMDEFIAKPVEIAVLLRRLTEISRKS